MRRRSVPVLSALLVGLLATSCSAGGSAGTDSSAASARPAGDAGSASAHAPRDPASVRANELGQVPVLMYHQLTEHPASVYDRTPADFRAELERLAREGYVPITAAEFTGGRIDVPAGAHPVVLTFDDSTNSQVRLGADGRPAPDSALGILLDVARRHPGFRATATFFVNSEPFSATGGKQALGWLAAHGFEVGNHTMDHSNLRTLGDEEVQHEIAGDLREIRQLAPGARVVSFALPFGSMPEQAALAVRGSSQGVSYQHRGVYLVGANPAPSPFSASFDAAAIPRIRSEGANGQEAEYGSTAWLDRLAANPSSRYTSDGDPATVAFPKAEESRLAPAYRARARAY
ncbi:polysaccharide deacetylase family protein [Streptacidiphilus sp. ASG 303]|uniref:polysaccharide deacetylase family protein n=1 Tax=Streptacidiphilus sp. ASG 303 TaxID=2896847 RepID=UPI001E52943C|nr:polysaccharide deacetylase family protein [Streptacidiphilus sp. ASG 303]MCD0480919.1 polysaccharide deacetylase family protein [Streptacidiphilus sp. ASG 303]